MTVSELCEALQNKPAWSSLLGPSGHIMATWRSETEPNEAGDWARAYRAAVDAERSVKAYASTWKADGNRLHANLCALMAIRLGDLDLADRHLGREGQARHFWNRGQLSANRTVDHEVVVPVAFTTGQTASIAKLVVARLITPANAIWEDPEMALYPLGQELLETIDECRPTVGAFAWALSLDPKARTVTLDGRSCGGALRLAFFALEKRRAYQPDYLILADQKFRPVEGVIPKLRAAKAFGLKNIVLGTGTNLDLQSLQEFSGITIMQLPDEQKAGEIATEPQRIGKSARHSQVLTEDRSRGVVQGESPYVGPRPFSQKPKEADLYFRGLEDWWPLAKALTMPKSITLLHAPSGAGKTSLLNTILRSSLEQVGIEVLPTARLNDVRDTQEPLNPYTSAAIASMFPDRSPSQVPLNWPEYFSSLEPSDRSRLLIIDQLEEIITGPSRPDVQKLAFFIEIRQALENQPWLRVLFCFRDEYLVEIRRLGQFDNVPEFPLPKLSLQDAKDSIERPALEEFGVEYESEVVEQLLDELKIGKYVEPFQLQVTCEMLWSRLLPGVKRISMDQVRQAVADIPTLATPVRTLVAWANSKFCDDVITRVSQLALIPGHDPYPTELLELGLGQLIENGYRRSLFEGGGFTGDLPTLIADEMARRNLLRCEKRLGRRMFELAHDRLVAPILERPCVEDHALRELFRRCVDKAADACGVDRNQMAEDFLLAFVSPDGARDAVSKNALEDGSPSLTWKFVQSLECTGLLRPGREAPDASLELSHPKLARALLPMRREAFRPRHRTRLNLRNYIEAARRAYGDELQGCFQSCRELLTDVDGLVGFAGLSRREANFVLRASLASGYFPEKTAAEISGHYPDLALEIVEEGTRFENADVALTAEIRSNAARILGHVAVPNRTERLVGIALFDQSPAARKAAALSLAAIDDPEAWRQLSDHLADSRTRKSAEIAASWIYDAPYPHAGRRRFVDWWDGLPTQKRSSLRRRRAAIRFQAARGTLLRWTGVAVLSTIVFVAPVRAILGAWGLTVTQFSPDGLLGLVESGFLGVMGGAIWGSFIAFALLSWWFVVEDQHPLGARRSGLRSAIVGGMAGLIGGALISLTLMFVYGPGPLKEMAWIETDLKDALTKTGMAYAMPFSGTLVGISAGLLIRGILSAPQRSNRIEVKSASQGYAAACLEAATRSWRIFIVMMPGALLFRLYLTGMTVLPHEPSILNRLLGDHADVGIGGVGLTAGLLLGRRIVLEQDADFTRH